MQGELSTEYLVLAKDTEEDSDRNPKCRKNSVIRSVFNGHCLSPLFPDHETR